jgi:transposase InsO family protein
LIAQTKDSLWSLDLFRCESILLRSYWVVLVMDVFTRRIIGFGVERAPIDGISVCRMFNHAIAGRPLPKHLSTEPGGDSALLRHPPLRTVRESFPSHGSSLYQGTLRHPVQQLRVSAL